MIRSYTVDEILQTHLTGDEDNPTIFHFYPMTSRAKARWRAMVAHSSKRIFDTFVDETAERALTLTDRAADEEVAFISAQVNKVTNAVMHGKHCESINGDEVKTYVEGMLATQKEDLVGLMQDDVKLQALSFRDHPVSAAGSGEAQDSQGEDRG